MTTTTPQPHVHFPDLTHGVLRVEWCRCGMERRTDRKDARWTKPRKMTGILRAAQWRGE